MVDIKDAMTIIEATLINDDKVDYLESQEILGCIHILVSKKEWEHVPLHERIMSTYSLLEFEHDEILENFPVIVECLSPNELTEYFKLHAK